MAHTYYVYIATNNAQYVLYTGVTNNIDRRQWEHAQGIGSQFTKKCNINKIVYLEEYSNIQDALKREKQIKAGSRSRKVALINSMNPTWRDLSGTTDKQRSKRR